MASSIDASTSGAGGVITTADNTGVLQLKTAGTTAVTVDASQNVGIGTTSPSVKLHLKGASFANAIRWEETGGNNNFYAGPIDSSGNFGLDNNSGSGYTRFVTNSAERMRIDSSGNVMIATTTTATVTYGNPRITVGAGAKCVLTDAGVYEGQAGATVLQYVALWKNPNGVVGSISTNGSATAYNTSSDYRLKENVQAMTGALDKVALLKPVTYKWKVDGSDGQGFIAHELAEVVPDAVVGEKDAVDAEGNPKYQGVDTSFLVATLTAAIQEQQTIINDLKARIEILEAK